MLVDMMEALQKYAPDVLDQSLPVLKDLGIPIDTITEVMDAGGRYDRSSHEEGGG